MSPILCRCTVHLRKVLCSPSHLMSYALANACAKLSLILADVTTTVKSSMLTAAIMRSLPIFGLRTEVRFALLKFDFAQQGQYCRQVVVSYGWCTVNVHV